MSEAATVNAGAKIERAPQHFALIDVETTGLEPDARLLELGLLVMRYVDDGKALGWVVDHVIHRVFYFKQHENPDQPGTWLPSVFEAHVDNGLLKECAASDAHPWHLDEELAALVPERSIPIGRNVHFDTKVLERHMPKLAARLHYRHLDLTTLEMRTPMGPAVHPARAKSTHRSLQDCICELMALRDLGFTPREDLRDKGPSA